MKIALVFDPITQNGGAEKLLWSLADSLPIGSVFTAVANPEIVPKKLLPRIITSWIQNLPLAYKNPKPYLPFFPLAYESFDFSDFDCVISITTLFAKAVITQPHTLHIGYINSPPRFLYSKKNLEKYINSQSFGLALNPFFNWLKKYDQIATRRPDILIANSHNIQRKIRDIYHLDSQVVYPFADDFYFSYGSKTDRLDNFVLVSRLERWKNIDYVIEAFNHLPGKKLIVVGVGSDGNRLRKKAASNISFTGWIDSASVAKIVSSSQALIMPQNEDFGITSIEAQALRTPVIAFGQGGAVETVINNQTGILFPSQTVDSLTQAVNSFTQKNFSADKLYQNALKYREKDFIQNISKIIYGK